MLELTVLLISIVVILLVIYYKQNTGKVPETFQNYYLSSCHAGYKSFYDRNGEPTYLSDIVKKLAKELK
jgi:F0F1-type ATP synthase membrane subunit a